MNIDTCRVSELNKQILFMYNKIVSKFDTTQIRATV